jgi:hypothetical protein
MGVDICSVYPTPSKVRYCNRRNGGSCRDLEAERWNVAQNHSDLIAPNKVRFLLDEARCIIQPRLASPDGLIKVHLQTVRLYYPKVNRLA